MDVTTRAIFGGERDRACGEQFCRQFGGHRPFKAQGNRSARHSPRRAGGGQACATGKRDKQVRRKKKKQIPPAAGRLTPCVARAGTRVWNDKNLLKRSDVGAKVPTS
jgi:hypothetical protein